MSGLKPPTYNAFRNVGAEAADLHASLNVGAEAADLQRIP
jgi:hypothetical protein